MIQWTKPVFEELDVSGECTAYAGALRAERLACEPQLSRLTAAPPRCLCIRSARQGGLDSGTAAGRDHLGSGQGTWSFPSSLGERIS